MPPDQNNRTEPRSNVFLSAVLEGDGRSGPVRVRNISTAGALVEGVRMPAAGTRITLIRGQLRATGLLVWTDAQLGGLTFDGEIQVQDWIKRTGHEGQQRVDSMIASIRTGGQPARPHKTDSERASLAEISRNLEAVCQQLASLPSPTVKLSEAILELDAIAQTLRRLVRGSPF